MLIHLKNKPSLILFHWTLLRFLLTKGYTHWTPEDPANNKYVSPPVTI